MKNKLKTRVDKANKEKSVSSSSVSSFGFFCLDEIERENSHPTEYDTEEYGDEEEDEEEVITHTDEDKSKTNSLRSKKSFLT